MADDFDRSFDFFQRKNDGEGNVKDIFKQSEQSWSKGNSGLLDTSLEKDLFEFSATKSSLREKPSKLNIFPEDPFDKHQTSMSSKADTTITVQIAIHEQLSAMYDDFSQEGAIAVTGSVHVKPTKELKSSFCLVLKEVSANIQKLELKDKLCEDISDKARDNVIYPSDRILRITLNPKDTDEEDVLIANYSCVTKLRPVPLVSSIV